MERKIKKYAYYVREIEEIPKGEIHRNLFAYAHEITREITRNSLLVSREIGEMLKKKFMETCSLTLTKLIEIS